MTVNTWLQSNLPHGRLVTKSLYIEKQYIDIHNDSSL